MKLVLSVLVLWAVFFPRAAFAHLIPAGEGTINVVGERAYVVLSIPEDAFSSEEDDPSPLDREQLRLRGPELREQVRERVRLSSHGEAGTVEQILFNLSGGADAPGAHGDTHSHGDPHHGHPHHGHPHGDARGSEVVVMMVFSFAGRPGSLWFESSLWPARPATLEVGATVSEGPRTLQAELGRLSPARSRYAFFASPREVMERAAWTRIKDALLRGDQLLGLALVLFLGVRAKRGVLVSGVIALSLGCVLWLTRSAELPASDGSAASALALGLAGVSTIAHVTWRSVPSRGLSALLIAVAGCGALQGVAFRSRALFGHRDELIAARVGGELVGVWAALLVLMLLVEALGSVLRSGAVGPMQPGPDAEVEARG